MFLLRRPDEELLARVLVRARQMPLSYTPEGLARGAAPAGFRVGQERAVLGYGVDVYTRAIDALREWQPFRLGWASVYPPAAPLEPGTEVLVVAPHLGFWSVHACRIVYLLGDDLPQLRVAAGSRAQIQSHIAGFAYGTLTEHAETGEEIFQVSWDPVTNEVIYTVRAVSREKALLARLGYPVARAMQARFRRDSAASMRRAVAARLAVNAQETGQ